MDYNSTDQMDVDSDEEEEGGETSTTSRIAGTIITEMSPYIDINDYTRINHILYNHIFRFTYDETNDIILFNVVDLTKPRSDLSRVSQRKIDYFFESTRKKLAYSQHELQRRTATTMV
jgi:hypothetical protein